MHTAAGSGFTNRNRQPVGENERIRPAAVCRKVEHLFDVQKHLVVEKDHISLPAKGLGGKVVTLLLELSERLWSWLKDRCVPMDFR